MSPRAALPAVLLLFLLALPGRASAQATDPKAPPKTVDELIAQLEHADPEVRRLAVGRARNFAGTHLGAVEEASRREGLAPAVRDVLNAVLPALRYRAARLKLSEEIEAYDLRSMTEAYEKAGKKDPRWDGLVKEALDLTNRPASEAPPRQEVVAAFRKAVDAGCDDPLILYFYARNEWVAGPADLEAVLERHRKAALALADTDHPAEWVCRAAARYMEQTNSYDEELAEICIKTLPRALAETGRPNDDVSGFVDLLQKALSLEDGDQRAFDRIYPVYLKARPATDPGPHLYKGVRYISAAWDARGSGWANTVTPEGWELFHKRLAIAREALEKGWKADPKDARCAAEMLRVLTGESGNKGEMEMWFRRAMANNPDNYTACYYKLRYLYPRWHGSHAEMLVFGRQCLATENWWGPLPTVLVEAHETISKEMRDPQAYLAQPQVWDDIGAVYQSFLDIYPDAPRTGFYRSKMARWACECRQWEAARKLFADIGDKPDLTVFRSQAVYNYYRKKADKLAAGAKQVSL